MESHALIEIADQWFKAFNAQDLEALLALHDEHAQHWSPRIRDLNPEGTGTIIGIAALRTWWSQAFERLPSLKYTVLSMAAAGTKQVFIEYIRTVDEEPLTKVVEVFVISEGGLITHSHVYSG